MVTVSAFSIMWDWVSARVVRRLLLVAVIAFLLLLSVSPTFVSAYAGLGGYISEKTLGLAGSVSSLYLGSGTAGPIVLGSSPTVSTGTVTDAVLAAGGTTATLHGTLSSLNGFPRADVWFVWGDSPSTMTNTTTAVTVTTLGDKAATITGYDPGGRVYYQFRSSTDGTALGGIGSFVVTGDRGIGYWLLVNILTLIVAAGTLLAVLKFVGNPIAMLISVLIGIMAVFIIRSFLATML